MPWRAIRLPVDEGSIFRGWTNTYSTDCGIQSCSVLAFLDFWGSWIPFCGRFVSNVRLGDMTIGVGSGLKPCLNRHEIYYVED